ncbi:GNAT family N-acetyltransferase [Rhodovulum sp. DZ06]|uniref:GNAT family N-acetyltransferase n=1 Tax=Rhodovulum sp. DZ06 TaxID=3425126 RepID=UPI003D32EF78
MSAGATLRTAAPDEVARMLDWAAAEGWNPGLEDAAAFRAADPDGFFVAEAGGEIVAAISVVNHGPGFAFLGLYLCVPERRGQGIGYALWTHALAHAEGRTVGLDGVEAQQGNYATSGFVRTGATTRWEGTAPAATDPRIRDMGAGDAPALAALDEAANGVARPRFLAAWLAPSETRRTLVLDGPHGPAGFATARLCREGAKVGPVIAPDAAAALALTAAAARAVGAARIAVDLPAQAGEFAGLLKAAGFAPGFTTARMYKGPAPRTGPGLHAIATMELG